MPKKSVWSALTILVAMFALTPLARAQNPAPAVPPAPAAASTDAKTKPALVPTTSAIAPAAATPAAPATPASPPSPISSIRNKISAADLLSAESILEVHKAKYGEDGPWLVGLSWLARGALLMGDPEKAKTYAAQVRARCADRMDSLATNERFEIAFGAAIEVEAQLIERAQGKAAAEKYLRNELAKIDGPIALLSRLHKRLRMVGLAGNPAPELAVEDFVGNPPPSLASLKGKPVVLFVWAEGCGDCKAQAATLARVKERHAGEQVQFVALTRYYDADSLRATEKARVDSVWKAVYKDVGEVPIVLSTASMEQYGGSSTPTFAFVDRKGIVRRYTPTRLTEAEFDRSIAMITKQ